MVSSDAGEVWSTVVDVSVTTVGNNTMPIIDTSANKNLYKFNLWVLNGIFLLWTSCFHGIYAADRYFFPSEKKSLSLKLRWLEYFSASIMLIIIMLLSGITDIYLLVALAAMMWVVMDYGWAEEFVYEMNLQDQVGWVRPSIKGGFPFLVVWTIIIVQFYNVIQSSDVKPPTFVYLIVFILAFQFSLFWVVQLRYLIKKPSGGWYPRGSDDIYLLFREMDGAYHFLSIAAKATLAFFVAAGFERVIE
jgi:hypothetical protein